MFVLDGNVYRKVYTRKNSTKYYIKDGKRITISSSRTTVTTKPRVSCKEGYERVNGKCLKKCIPPKRRNPETNRCKKPQMTRRSPSPLQPSPRQPSPRRSPTPRRSPQRNARFFDLSNNRYVIPDGGSIRMIQKMIKFINENNLKDGDILFIGHENISQVAKGFYFVDHSKEYNFMSLDGLYYIDDWNEGQYNYVMENYKKAIKIPNVSYDSIKNRIFTIISKLDPDDLMSEESDSDYETE